MDQNYCIAIKHAPYETQHLLERIDQYNLPGQKARTSVSKI